ncbi:putative RNA recognition motif domain, nucleotide-binding alpha-beta plait domain superfamily [Helianthus annuus]|nr:putative RNA recognition motif domain, nucleotide-binding alpha-beta plait domain superfamily [Helianthus annuus]
MGRCGRQGLFRNKEGWNTVLRKQEARQEKKCVIREARPRNATTFFISNLPDGCNRDRLWRAFGFLENLEDVIVPWKRDRAGNTFGFLKLSNVKEVDIWIDRLKEVKIDGAVIGVNLAKFNRHGSKIETPFAGERVSVFSRLKFEKTFRQERLSKYASDHSNHCRNDGRSYSDVVHPQKLINTGISLELPPLNTDSKKKCEFKSLVGEAKDLETLNNLKFHLAGLVDEGPMLRYLGGLKVLVTKSIIEEADEFLRNQSEVWASWFSRLYVWDGTPPLFERVAWIKVFGVPASLWDRHVLNRIGERCGRLLVKSDVSPDDGNLAEDRMAILVHTGKPISMEMNLVWKNHSLKVWVEEIIGHWSTDFLSNESSELSDAGRSPEVAVSSEFGGRKWLGCLSDVEPSCMGIHNAGTYSKTAAHGEDCDFPSVSHVADLDGHVEQGHNLYGVHNTPVVDAMSLGEGKKVNTCVLESTPSCMGFDDNDGVHGEPTFGDQNITAASDHEERESAEAVGQHSGLVTPWWGLVRSP